MMVTLEASQIPNCIDKIKIFHSDGCKVEINIYITFYQ